MSRVVFALGSNLGDRLANLAAAVQAIRAAVRLEAISPVYETDPVGGPAGQPAYLNAVVVADSAAAPEELLRLVQEWEAAAHRVRTERWGPRTLDVDIITVDGTRSESAELTLPHPRAYERAFVLVPWADVEPDAVLPGHGRVGDLAAAIDASGVHRRDDLDLGSAGR